MSIQKIYELSRLLLINPEKAWLEIARDGMSSREAIIGFLLPFSLLIGISSIAGSLVQEGIQDSFSLGILLLSGVISMFIIFLEVYTASWLVLQLSKSLSGSSDPRSVFKLVIYSHIPFFLTLILSSLFRELLFINLFGLYSFFIFWLGTAKMTELTRENRIILTALAAVIMVLLYLLFTIIFNNFYDLLVNQFTTFAG